MEFTPPFSRVHVERIVAGARVALAAASLFAVWLDPAEPGRHAQVTYALHAIYVVYSGVLALLMWRRDSVGNWPLVTHVADIAVASVFQYLTLGPSSPFFVYFVFALFSAALRWGSRGTIRTAGVVLVAFMVMGASLSRTLGPAEFELSRFIIRLTYLMVITVFLAYLGQHEEGIRDEVRRLARWPLAAGHDLDASVSTVLEHSAGIVRASRALLIWERDDEPWLYVASWPPGGLSVTRHGPGEIDHAVPTALQDSTFVVPGRLGVDSAVILSRAGAMETWTGAPVHQTLVAHLDTRRVVSAPFRSDRLSGRTFFSGVSGAGVETLPLVEVVAREVCASLEQLFSFQRSREIAISEDRIRLARDLHDGVLQSLTGVRLELQTLATSPRRRSHARECSRTSQGPRAGTCG
jgi:signal transduction histidine kinase